MVHGRPIGAGGGLRPQDLGGHLRVGVDRGHGVGRCVRPVAVVLVEGEDGPAQGVVGGRALDYAQRVPEVVGEHGAVGVIGGSGVEDAAARVGHGDGHRLGVGVVDVARGAAVALDDGVGVGLADVGRRVRDLREGDRAVGLVGSGADHVPVRAAQLEGELAGLEGGAGEGLRRLEADRALRLVGDQGLHGVRGLRLVVDRDGRLVGQRPVAGPVDVLGRARAEVGVLADGGGDAEDVAPLGVSVPRVLRGGGDRLPGGGDGPVVGSVDVARGPLQDGDGCPGGVQRGVEGVCEGEGIGFVGVRHVGEDLGDVECGRPAALDDLDGLGFDGGGPLRVNADLGVVTDAGRARVAPPSGAEPRPRPADDGGAVGGGRRAVVAARAEPGVGVGDDQFGGVADGGGVLVAADEVDALAPVAGVVVDDGSVGPLVHGLVDVPVEHVHLVGVVDGRVGPGVDQRRVELEVDADGRRVLVLRGGGRQRPVAPRDLEGRQPRGFADRVGGAAVVLPGEHVLEVEDGVDGVAGRRVADVVETDLEARPAAPVHAELPVVRVAPDHVLAAVAVEGVRPVDLPPVADLGDGTVLGVLVRGVEVGEGVPCAVGPVLALRPVGVVVDVHGAADSRQDVPDAPDVGGVGPQGRQGAREQRCQERGDEAREGAPARSGCGHVG